MNIAKIVYKSGFKVHYLSLRKVRLKPINIRIVIKIEERKKGGEVYLQHRPNVTTTEARYGKYFS